MSNAVQTTSPALTFSIRDAAEAVAQHLPGWTLSGAETNEYHAILKHESGPEFSLGINHWKRRLHVSGSWPRDPLNGSYMHRSGAPTISVGVTRGPKSIAREIERRFLPAFLPLWHAAEGRRRQAEESNAKAEDLARRLEDVLGLPHRLPSSHGLGREALHLNAGDAAFEVRRYGSVKIEITTSREDVALRVAEFVRAMGLDKD